MSLDQTSQTYVQQILKRASAKPHIFEQSLQCKNNIWSFSQAFGCSIRTFSVQVHVRQTCLHNRIMFVCSLAHSLDDPCSHVLGVDWCGEFIMISMVLLR